jgi:hypothetical protein
MASEPLSTVVLVSTPNEVEAALIVDTLVAHGIRATMAGAYAAGFHAEAPGEVRILVNAADARQAWKVLTEIQGVSGEFDGDPIDIDEGQTPDGSTLEPMPASQHSFQFSLRSLLLLQLIVSIVLTVVCVVKGEVVLAGLVAGLGLGLTILGTIKIAADLNRARHVWQTLAGPLILLMVGLWLIGMLIAALLLH